MDLEPETMSEAPSEDLKALATPEKLARMRRNWRFQHIGWAGIAILVLAGAVGLFGSGPLSSTTHSADGLTVELNRFIRRETPFTIKVTATLPPESTQARLSLPRHFFDDVRVSSLMPEPVEVVTTDQTTTFVFAVDTPRTLTIHLHCEARRSGLLHGEITAGDARLRFTQFVWP